MVMIRSSRPLLLLIALVVGLTSSATATNVTYDGRAIIINGERRLLFGGSIHYPRSTADVYIFTYIKFQLLPLKL